MNGPLLSKLNSYFKHQSNTIQPTYYLAQAPDFVFELTLVTLALAMAPRVHLVSSASRVEDGAERFDGACHARGPNLLALALLQRYQGHAEKLAVLLNIERAQLRPESQAKLDLMVEDNRAVMCEISDALAHRRLHVVG